MSPNIKDLLVEVMNAESQGMMNQALSPMQGGYSIGGTNPGTYDEYGRMIESGDSAVNSLIMHNNVQQGVKKSLTGSSFYDHLAEVDKNSLISALVDKLLGRNMQPAAQDTVLTPTARGVGHPQWFEQGGRLMDNPPKP